MFDSLFAELFASQTIGTGSIMTVVVSMLLAAVVGLAVAWVYRFNYRGVMYSPNFALTLVMMTLVTTPVVLCIRNSIALSMGMVGALSIVRFRTAVKDPLDTAYMFWALTMGILLGAGQFLLTAIVVVMLGLLMTLFVNLQAKGANSYLLVIRMSPEAERIVTNMVNSLHSHKLKSKTASASAIEATYEVRLEKPDAVLTKLRGVGGVQDATLVSYQGETV